MYPHEEPCYGSDFPPTLPLGCGRGTLNPAVTQEVVFGGASMVLPSIVRVLATDFRLEHLPEEECRSRGILGDTDINEGTIRVRASLPRSKLREVLLHEILHALWDAMNLNEALIGKTLETDELPVNALAVGLITFTRDNPRLAMFLFPPHGSSLS